MSSDDQRLPGREPVLATFVGAGLLAFPIGALVGALEALKLVLQGHARYASDGLGAVALSTGGSALLAVVLSIPCAFVARILWGRVERRVALPSACAGLGAGLGMIAFTASDLIGLSLVAPIALAATAFVLLLRELFGWWKPATRAPLWSAFAAVALVTAIVCAWRLPSGRASAAPRNGRTNVLLLSIDTLRADRLGCYGSKLATPSLDRLAAEGVVFDQAISQSNITGPSHTTMLTGLYPAEHGALANGQPIPNRTRTWIEDLAAAGYDTAGFVSGFTLVDAASGLAERFEHFDDHLLAWRWMPEVCTRLRLVKDVIRCLNVRGTRVQRPDRPARETIDAVERWLGESAGAPHALFVHFYDPHVPYHPPAPFDRRYDADWKGEPFVDWYRLSTAERKDWARDPAKYAHMLALHHGEISYADEQAGRLFELLRKNGEYDETMIVVTSDHGEELGEHEIFFDHGGTLYDTELRVPLIVKWPKSANVAAGTRVASQVRSLDIAPTICEAADVKPSYALSGASLRELIDGAAHDDRPAYSFADLPGNMSDYELDARAIAVRQNGRKLIWTSEYWLDCERVAERWQLFDLVRDPGELNGVTSPPSGDEQVDKLRAAVQHWIELTANQSGPLELSPETREGLKATGYF
ncbi:MAG: sulfatase-like hydrolase/transferase [Planctomycetes bacterium]|nr:sulfatase-like hydrolase/transferase [Planctomycetota bacterium]